MKNLSFAANFNTVLPLSYYNRLADRLGPIEEAPTYGASAGVFFNPDIVNPSSFNRQNGWPIKVRSNMKKEEQVRGSFIKKLISQFKNVMQEEITDLISTAMERFQWQSTEIANFLKVIFCKLVLLFIFMKFTGICVSRFPWTSNLAARGTWWLGRSLGLTWTMRWV